MNFSAYLTGSWENRSGVGTKLQIINPSLNNLEILVAFFDSHGNFLRCVRSEESLLPTGMWEIKIPEMEVDFGVVKVVSHINGEVKAGLVGFQRRFLSVKTPMDAPFSESQLSAIPMSKAQKIFDTIIESCPSE
jgi:hypothetical protein